MKIDAEGSVVTLKVDLNTVDAETRQRVAAAVERAMHKTQSKPLEFQELARGNRFIAFPMDGDDSGHGGYRSGSYLFMKLDAAEAARLSDGIISSFPSTMKVLRIYV